MSDASNEPRVENDETGVKLMDKTLYYSRNLNPWPTPQTVTSSSSSTLFRKAGEQASEPKKKYGGGFGGNLFSNTISSFDDFSGFAARKEKTAAARPSLFGSGLLSSSSRLAAGDSAPSSESVPNVTRRSSGFTSSPRSEVVTPTKRHRSGRRTGRRGRSGPGHCFHCQEHGHISRLCPKKTVEDTDEFDEIEANRFLDDEILSGTPKAVSLVGRDSGSRQTAKLENQKARDSYYFSGATTGVEPYNYRARQTNSSIVSSTSKSVNALTAKYAALGTSAVSPDSDNFSEQLDNALKLPVTKPTVTTPPRTLTSAIPKAPAGRIGSSKTEAAPVSSASLGLGDRIKETSSETMTIETRRAVMLGDTRFEETTIISFPSVLPPNVRVITAQFVPVSSQVPGEIVKEKF